jgi:hypothetical protein
VRFSDHSPLIIDYDYSLLESRPETDHARRDVISADLASRQD